MIVDFIKLSRKLLEWEWYDDINTCRLFIHLLLKANWKVGKFQGVVVPRGSLISSYQKLSEETRLSVRSVRTSLNHLKSTGEVTSKGHSKFSVFTVINYDLYQSTDTQSDKQATSNRQTSDKQPTTIEERKNIRKKEVKKKYGEFKHVLLTDAEHERLINDFGDSRLALLIKNLDEGIELKGYKYKNHNLALRKWAKNDKPINQTRQQPRGNMEGLRDFLEDTRYD